MKGTLGAHTTEVPSKCTESQPTGNKKKCFLPLKNKLKEKEPPCFSQTKIASSVYLPVHYHLKGSVSISDLKNSGPGRADHVKTIHGVGPLYFFFLSKVTYLD